ncbi:hypothetical protein GCM10009000_087350 [Halobacterium noricense]|uniref:Uncharacterized protein n=1 Tax=Haladaptatus pallidirubidus TaxID=1008152 RepID=A0AAV3USK4_9EURY
MNTDQGDDRGRGVSRPTPVQHCNIWNYREGEGYNGYLTVKGDGILTIPSYHHKGEDSHTDSDNSDRNEVSPHQMME